MQQSIIYYLFYSIIPCGYNLISSSAVLRSLSSIIRLYPCRFLLQVSNFLILFLIKSITWPACNVNRRWIDNIYLIGREEPAQFIDACWFICIKYIQLFSRYCVCYLGRWTGFITGQKHKSLFTLLFLNAYDSQACNKNDYFVPVASVFKRCIA